MPDAKTEFGTVLGPDARFKGDLEFDSAARLLGRFEGSITSKGSVHVADGAECKATIAAKEISVEGHVEGNVEAGDRIEVKPTGVVTGDIQAARMTMAEGASVNGYLRIGTNGKAGSNGTPSAGSASSSSSGSSGGSSSDSKSDNQSASKAQPARR